MKRTHAFQKPTLGSRLDLSSHLAMGLNDYWLMNEGSGLVLGDSYGSGSMVGQSGISNSSWVAGHFGQAISLTGGSNQFFLTNTRLGSPVAGDVTLIGWAWTPRSNATQWYFSCYQAGGWAFGRYNTGAGYGLVFYNSSGGQFVGTGNQAWQDGNWHQIGFTVKGLAITGYVDGEVYFAGTLSYAPAAIAASSSIGAKYNNTYTWNGGIDNIGFWSRALRDSEVKDLYQNPFFLWRDPRLLWSVTRVPINISKTVSYSSLSSVSMGKAVTKSVSPAASSSVAGVRKSIHKPPLAAVSGSVASITKNASKKIATTSTSITSAKRAVSKSVRVSTSSVVTATKAVHATVHTVTSSIATVLAGRTILQNIAAVSGSVASVSRSVIKVIGVSSASNTSVSKSVARVMGVISPSVVGIVKGIATGFGVVTASIAGIGTSIRRLTSIVIRKAYAVLARTADFETLGRTVDYVARGLGMPSVAVIPNSPPGHIGSKESDITFSLDFTQKLLVGESIINPQATVYLVQEGAEDQDVTSDLLQGNAAISGNKALATIGNKNAVKGSRYYIEFVCDTTNGRSIQDQTEPIEVPF